jgi:hypothetical protein
MLEEYPPYSGICRAATHFAEIEGLAWIPFSRSEEDTVRERVRRYYAGELPE